MSQAYRGRTDISYYRVVRPHSSTNPLMPFGELRGKYRKVANEVGLGQGVCRGGLGQGVCRGGLDQGVRRGEGRPSAGRGRAMGALGEHALLSWLCACGGKVDNVGVD